jgi:glycosyltransferase involved in cell wall biosynthesis
MIDSKFDDKPRFLWRELVKKVFFLPYNGALASGDRARDYLRFLGFDPAVIHLGYDTVSMDRIRRLAGSPPAPGGVGFDDRHFTIIARLVPKKNIATALAAYAEYRRLTVSKPHELHICGSGELEDELRAVVKRLGVEGVVFRGFVQSPEVAHALASTLALILPSVEDQWGLVINEALAMGVPILCSLNVGARDLLVRVGVNGFLFEPDNPAGLAYFMCRLTDDENEWRRLAEGSIQLAPLADTRNFSASVARLVHGRSSQT